MAAWLVPLCLFACSRSENAFEIDIGSREVTAATLNLCGRQTSLSRSGNLLVTTRAIDCEGSGEIIVSFPDRSLVRCPVGYVTHGLVQTFRFEIDGQTCRDIRQRPSS
ncbi:hypothetical protein [Rhodoligotrophos defluvii]|uniref:hypothetical protein n=1 Tax=Rhodoligotrophos defluvii TaxID=2561934 RepID=UPI0010C97227|nr:hypothetical protein [Rhodoligotrophos defluvii]